MHIPPERFSRDALAALSDAERDTRLRELEALINPEIRGHQTLADFQQHLYATIEQLCDLGHWLSRWDYDSEVEIWGGKSYLDPDLKEELMLRSEFRHGIKFAWRDYDPLSPSD